MSTRINILILTPFYHNVGGAESFTKDLIKEVSKHHEVTLCTLKARKNVWQGTSIQNLLIIFPLAFYFLTHLLKKNFSIVHAQGMISGLLAVTLKKVFSYKVFVTLLALYEFDKRSKLFNAVAQFIFNNCDIIFVEGANGQRDIARLKQDDRVRQFHHWVDQDNFKPPESPRTRDKVRVLFIGRPIFEKGRHIIEDAERLLEGKGYEFRYIENAPLEELPSHYQWADILCVPSLYAEGYVRVVAEGASCGCAIITSDRGSLPEMVKDFGISIQPHPRYFVIAIQIFNKNEWIIPYHYAQRNFSSKNAEVFLKEYETIKII